MRRKSKYNNKKTTIGGITFDSKKEAERYLQLKPMALDGRISELELQLPYLLSVNDMKICIYKADFRYIKDGEVVVEDVKGVLTDVYKLKKKLMKAIHNIDIYET